MKEDTKKTIKNIAYWIFLVSICVFIFISSYKIGDMLAPKDNEYSESYSYKREESTKNFEIKYNEEVYNIKSSSNNIVVNNVKINPIINSEKYKNQAKKIELLLENIINDLWNKSLEYSLEYAKSENLNKTISSKYILQLLDYKEDEYITFKLDIDESFNSTFKYGYTFDVSTGDLLSLNSITYNEDELYSIILNEIINALATKDYVDDLDQNWKENIAKLLRENNFGFYLNDNKLNLVIPANTIGYDKYISIEMNINNNEKISNLLLDKYKK